MITLPNLLNMSHHLDTLVSNTCLVLARRCRGLTAGLHTLMIYFCGFKLMPVQNIHILVEEGAPISNSYYEWQTLGEEMSHHF